VDDGTVAELDLFLVGTDVFKADNPRLAAISVCSVSQRRCSSPFLIVYGIETTRWSIEMSPMTAVDGKVTLGDRFVYVCRPNSNDHPAIRLYYCVSGDQVSLSLGANK